jgi:hypothetical protein
MTPCIPDKTLRYACAFRKSKLLLQNAISRFTIDIRRTVRKQERQARFRPTFSRSKPCHDRQGGGSTDQHRLAARRPAAPGCRLAPSMEAQLRAITDELDATTRSWADVGASAQRYHTYPPACQDHRDVVDMSHRSTHANHFKIHAFSLKLKRFLDAITQQAFDAADADARRHGWQVTSTRGGFGRRYRDPRFDRLVPCTACNGHGCDPRDTSCSACHGTGRIGLDAATLSERGRGQP